MSFDNRTVAGLVMVGLFVMGGVTGGMVTGLLTRDDAPTRFDGRPDGVRRPPPRGVPGPRSVLPAQYLDRLDRELELSEEQRDSIEAILEAQRRQAQATLEELGPVLRAGLDSAMSQVRAVLHSDQQDRFDSLVVREREILGRRLPPVPRR